MSRVLVIAWLLAWFWVPVGLFGRTLLMAVIGLAVVRRSTPSEMHASSTFIVAAR